MRVLVLSQYYLPEPIPKPPELAVELRQRQHAVAVLTGFPNYPAGKLYEGFRLRLVRREEIDGIPVTRTFEYPYHGHHVLGRLLNYASFMVSAVFGSLFTPSCDVIYVWHPPLTIGVAAWLIARLRRVPFVYDVQDIWPESAVLSGLMSDNWLVRLMARLERFIYRRANHILVVTEGARRNLIEKGVAPEKVTVLPHWIDEGLFSQTDPQIRETIRCQYGWEDHFVVLFAGNLGLVQGLDTAILAMKLLSPEEKVRLVLIGDGADRQRLQELVATHQLQDRVQFIERQPMERMPGFMAAADTLLVHLKRSQLSHYVIPSKTMAYLAAGKPILMAMEGAAADLVSQANAGITVQPEDPAQLAEAIRCLRQRPAAERQAMGQRGRDYLLTNLSKQKVIRQYEAILQQFVPGSASSKQ